MPKLSYLPGLLLLSYMPIQSAYSLFTITIFADDVPHWMRIYVVYAAVLVLFSYSVIKYIRLEKFSFFRAFSFPVIYAAILALTLNYSNVDGLIFTVLAGIPGAYGGLLLGRNAFFVKRHSFVLYRRSIFASFVWTLTLYVRLSVMFFYPVFEYIIFSSAFLSLFTGLILGEAVRIYVGDLRWRAVL